MPRLLLVLLLLVPACAKKIRLESRRNVLEDVCRIERERHGDIDFHSDFTYFGNGAMDAYVGSPGPPEELWLVFEETRGVCRGALIQLMVDVYPEILLPRLERAFDGLGTQERIHVLELVRRGRHGEMEGIIARGLGPDQETAVRRQAVAALDSIDQNRFREDLLAFVRRERDPSVLEPLVLVLDPAAMPWQEEIFAILYEHSATSVHESILTTWATSDLEDKRERIGRYRDHPDESVREMADFLLVQLEEKGRLSWRPQTPMVTRAVAEVDPAQLRQMRLAASENDRETAKRLLEEGFSFEQVGGHYGSTLVDILIFSTAEMFSFFLEEGMDAAYRDNTGNSLLMLLVRHGYRDASEKIEILVAAGADVDSANRNGETALMAAVFNNKSTLIETLLEQGADPGKRDNLGRTALTIAEMLEQEASIRVLENWKP